MNKGFSVLMDDCDLLITFPYDVSIPIILPRGHWISKLIVRHCHELANHSDETNFILSQICERLLEHERKSKNVKAPAICARD